MRNKEGDEEAAQRERLHLGSDNVGSAATRSFSFYMALGHPFMLSLDEDSRIFPDEHQESAIWKSSDVTQSAWTMKVRDQQCI